MMVLGTEFFTPMAFDFLWESMEIGEAPYPLSVPSHGANIDERTSMRHRIDRELKARGIRDAAGTIEPRVAEWLVTLALPAVSVDALHIPEFRYPPVAAIAASKGTNGVLAVQDVDGVWLRSIDQDGLASAIVDLLPHGKRGAAASITLPLDEALQIEPDRLSVTARASDDLVEQGNGRTRRNARSRGSLTEQATDPREVYAKLIGQPRLRGGQLAANGRDHHVGHRYRSPVIAWFDTATGRYLSLPQTGSDGREWVTVAPCDAKTLRGRLTEMLVAVNHDEQKTPSPGE